MSTTTMTVEPTRWTVQKIAVVAKLVRFADRPLFSMSERRRGIQTQPSSTGFAGFTPTDNVRVRTTGDNGRVIPSVRTPGSSSVT